MNIIVIGSATSGIPSPATVFSAFVRRWRAFFDPYRPERHYMRGPGPKWFGKHGCA